MTDSDLAILYKWTIHTRWRTRERAYYMLGSNVPPCLCDFCKKWRRREWDYDKLKLQ